MSRWPKINRSHRYLVRENSSCRYVSSTDDLGLAMPAGFILADTIGVDGLGPGIKRFLRERGAA